MTQQQEPFSCNTDAPCADCIPGQPHADRQGQPESCVEPLLDQYYCLYHAHICLANMWVVVKSHCSISDVTAKVS